MIPIDFRIAVSMFNLFHILLASMSREENKCHCPVPCWSLRYDPVLSYADLSTLSLDRLSLVDSEKEASVWNRWAIYPTPEEFTN